jgi:hypothetical protein
VWKVPEEYKPIPVWRPQTWLLRTGWRRHGLIRLREVPSERLMNRPTRSDLALVSRTALNDVGRRCRRHARY